MSAARPRRRPAPLALAGAVAAVAVGLPGTLGLVLGRAPRDWPIPFSVQHAGDAALRTVVYLSGFLVALGAIRITSAIIGSGGGAQALRRPGWLPESRHPVAAENGRGGAEDADGPAGEAAERSREAQGPDRSHRQAAKDRESDLIMTGRGEAAEPARETREFDRSPQAAARGDEPDRIMTGRDGDDRREPLSDHITITEPLYGFLPEDVQARLARETGYHALLYTKISILMTAAVGVLLAGSWEPLSELDPVPPAAAARVVAGLYLAAESFERYLLFAGGRPSGTLVGSLLYGALVPLRRAARR